VAAHGGPPAKHRHAGLGARPRRLEVEHWCVGLGARQRTGAVRSSAKTHAAVGWQPAMAAHGDGVERCGRTASHGRSTRARECKGGAHASMTAAAAWKVGVWEEEARFAIIGLCGLLCGLQVGYSWLRKKSSGRYIGFPVYVVGERAGTICSWAGLSMRSEM
jgi:hypothetical protein